MTCENAMVTPVISITEEQTIADAMALFETHGIRGVPVVDKDNRLVGLFTLAHLLRRLLPEAAVLENQPRLRHVEVSLTQIHGTMPWVAGRLKEMKHLKMKDVMVAPDVVRPDMPLREGIRLLEKYGSPIPVIDGEKTRKLLGVITSQSIVKTLNAMREAN